MLTNAKVTSCVTELLCRCIVLVKSFTFYSFALLTKGDNYIKFQSSLACLVPFPLKCDTIGILLQDKIKKKPNTNFIDVKELGSASFWNCVVTRGLTIHLFVIVTQEEK